MRNVKLNAPETASLVVHKRQIVCQRIKIQTTPVQYCTQKLLHLYEEWRKLQKNSKTTREVFDRKKQNL